VLQLLRQRPMTAGELADQFEVSKPTMSAHFRVLLAADLIGADKQGRTITYRLRMSVLEEALLGFAQAFGFQMVLEERAPEAKANPRAKKEKS
jgi:DNA-binding transcriptional ArsR family regulator